MRGYLNEETKQVRPINQLEAERLKLPDFEVEQAWNGLLYLKGYAPSKPVEEKQKEVRAVRNAYLEATDKYMIIDFPIIEEARAEYKEYRQYLRDYTSQENWWETEPKTFEEWLATKEDPNDGQ